MKIRIDEVIGYVGFDKVEFPIVVEVECHSEDMVTFHVTQEEFAKVPGWVWTKDDVWEGCNYVFMRGEVTVMEDSPMSPEDRKGLLIQLVQDYGVAINDGCYESECGSLQAMAECHEEEKRLLKEIIKMIEEGV